MFWKILPNFEKTQMIKSFFSYPAGLLFSTLLKKEPCREYFAWNFAKLFYRAPQIQA